MKITKLILLRVLICGMLCFPACERGHEPGELVWQFNMSGYGGYEGPTVYGDYVYAGSGVETDPFFSKNTVGYFYCINKKTGRLKWRFYSGGSASGSAVVIDDKVYFGSSWGGRPNRDPDGGLFCLDANTGERIWQWKTSNGAGSPAVVDGYIYTGSAHSIFCLDAETGEEIWKYDVGDNFLYPPVVFNDKVYINEPNSGKTHCIDAIVGNKLWSFSTKTDFLTSRPSTYGKHVFIQGRGDGSYLYCLNETTGEKLWQFDIGTGGRSSPSIANGLIYFGSGNGIVYCLKIETGEKVWEFQTDKDYIIIGSPAISSNKIYIDYGFSNILCLDAATGEFKWSYDTDDQLNSTAVSDGYVYISSYYGNIYCFKAAEGDNGSWPMFKGNPARTGSNED